MFIAKGYRTVLIVSKVHALSPRSKIKFDAHFKNN